MSKTVNTKSPVVDGGWDRAPRMAVAVALLDAAPRPLTAGELARKTGRDQSNVRKTADQMADEGLLFRNRPKQGSNRAGRKPTVAYALAEPAKRAAESHVEERQVPGQLHEGQHVVFASIDGPQLLDVLASIAEQGIVSRQDWIGSFDGSRQERMIAFKGKDSPKRAETLIGVLTALRVDCRWGILRSTATGGESIEAAKAVLEQAAAAAKAQVDRNVSW